MKTWITHSFDKIIADMPAPAELKKDYSLYLTKGGEGGCQIVASSDTDGKVQLKIKTLSGASVKLYSEHLTHEIKGHQYTDCIIPYSGEVLDIKCGFSLPFYLDFKAEGSGDHSAAFELLDGEGNVIDTFNVVLHVWSFSLPENKTFETAGFTNDYHIKKFDTECNEGAYKTYYDLLLEHGLSSYDLPYDILDPRADEYMSDPRVTSFVVCLRKLENMADEEVLKYYNKLKTNPVWLKKALIYSVDEPSTPKQIAEYVAHSERFERLCPGVSRIAPFYTDIQISEGRDQVDEMEKVTNHWCPKLSLWDDSKSYGKYLDYTPDKSFGARMNEFKARGDRMWAYVCNAPISPYAQFFIDTPGNVQRAMFWQMYQRDVDGFLYWGTNYWGFWAGDVDPWVTVGNGVLGEGEPVYGEGFLLFPGTAIGKPGPLPTVRLKLLRDSVNDVEMFNLAGEYFGREWVKERLNAAAPSLTEYSSADEMVRIRKEIGDAVDAAINK